jgi:hypothetical protein
MRISASVGSGCDRPRPDINQSVDSQAARGASLPALVPKATRSATAHAVIVRPVATLLAQLVAGAENLPASRVRRRTDPQTGADTYRATAELAPPHQRRAVRIF